MTDIQHLFEPTRRATRRWHVIDEIDLVPLLCEHARGEQLCRRLEACADALPDLPDAEAIAALCDALEAQAVERPSREDALLDVLFGAEAPPLADTLLAYIRAQHVTCAVQAQDLLAVLRPHAVDRGPCAATLGYMLRCFFEGCRAAMAFEELAIRTLAERRLTPAARLLLDDRLQARCRGA
ncbi:hypothetical protein [Sphingomonas desiccabilis]|uniref:Hemerythrin-like domain-containing protein n=1 Tax=Sphingomonas desiccabilis TaxID=429134 RepID=A0A4Q2J0Y1_9SPHN|nr:hypothetical protein [Sphingomonas desiccabilis]MBB3910295.1 hypothetical protein [Sphingomonas desiccabilis]RXZ34962.1 hypothetical protein EO081_04730 [Sphingomonas desiccabilis]